MIIWDRAVHFFSFHGRGDCLSTITRLALCATLLCLLPGVNAMAQSAGLTVGSASGTPSSSVTIPITFTEGSTAVSTLQFDLMFSSSLSYVADPDGNPGTDNLTGAAALAAGKTASANPIAGGVRVLIFGLNQYAIGSGVVASVTLNISASAPAGSVPLTLTGIAASDPTGMINVPVTPAHGSVTVVAPSDVTAPVISSVASSGLTSSAATITWTTNEASDTQVEYGTTTSYGASTTVNTAMVTSHSQALSGLTGGTLYHYRVKSKDASNNLATSADYTFTTPDGTAPVISAVSATGITKNGATITWTTNEASDTQVEYGTTTSYGASTTVNTSPVTSHTQALSGLASSTLYHYRVKSRDASNNLATSVDYTFTTLDGTAPVISAVSATGITKSAATITWTTNEASDTQVEYGTTTGYGAGTTLNTSLVTSHSQTLNGLASSTLYHYRVKSKDALGNPATSADYTFTTLDGAGPIISAVNATGITSSGATITWTTNEASDTQVKYGTTTSYGSSTAINSALVTSHSQTLTGLSPDTLYHYQVQSRDAAGNLADAGDYTFRTTAEQDKTAPAISSVGAINIGSTGATIRWTTDEASDTQVAYGATTSYGSSTALSGAMVTSHSQALSGLQPETLYHYKVRSKDAAGNLAESGDYTFTTKAAEDDKTAPEIHSVSATNIGGTSATINWTTDEVSDTQVVYGTTAGYGSSTALSSAMVTSHSQTLTGLTADTLYHYQVKSRDAAGNLAASGDFTFTTEADSPAPEISQITVTDVTSKSAKISWATDKPSDSEVEFWTGRSNSRKATSGDQVTKHSLTVNELKKETTYRFYVKSRDADGNQAVAPELTFTTDKYGAPVLVLPRFALDQDPQAPGAETIMGMALANLDSAPATLTLTALGSDGNLLEGPDVVNPSVIALPPGTQHPTHDIEIFSEGLSMLRSDGWIRLDTDTPEVDGLFMVFDSDMRLLDGANFAEGPITDFLFTEIQANGRNKISIVNTNTEDATVRLDLMKADGTIRSSQSHVIRMNGALTANLFADLFAGFEPDATGYIRVSSDRGVYPFQVMQQQQGDISTLAGQDITRGGTRIFSPQYVVGGPYRTTISVINLDSRNGMILLKLMGEDGHQTGPTRLLAIPANGKVYIDEQMFFLTPDPDAMFTGYVEMTSDGVRLAGSTVFGDRKGRSFASALALVADLQTSVVFSHVASSDLYFTGIAIFNPDTKDASVKLELYGADGKLIEMKRESIPAGRRNARLVSEYFSSLQGSSRTAGYIRLTSSRPIASFALFGTWDLSVLSAIPPQVIQ